MNKYQEQYKGANQNDTTSRRIVRAGQQIERQKNNRAANFWRNRHVVVSPVPSSSQVSQVADPETRLRRWKLEKAMKKKLEEKKKKPVFKVGIVHHRLYSPPVSNKAKGSHTPCHSRGTYKVKAVPSPPKRITRATQKRLDAKQANHTLGEKTPLKKLKNKSFAPENYIFKGPAGVEQILMAKETASEDDPVENHNSHLTDVEKALQIPWPESTFSLNKKVSRFSLRRQDAEEDPETIDEANYQDVADEENIGAIAESDPPPQVPANNSQKEQCSTDLETPPRGDSQAPASFSPYITVARGKNSARKERRSRMSLPQTPDEIPSKETVMQTLNISVQEEERTAQYFKFILQREIDRLEEICSKWEEIKSEPDVTEDAGYQINQAIGQTHLLIAKKFARFRSLVNDCETGKGEMLVQCRDLQGFWDMTYMEVKDVDARFQKLEILRSKNWVEDEIVVQNKKREVKKKVGPKFNARVKSSVRSWILAKKKTMAQSVPRDENGVLLRSQSERASSPENRSLEKTPNEKSATRRSVRKSPQTNRASLNSSIIKTPTSLLKKVQISQVTRSPLAIMKISKTYKTPEVRLDDTITYINSDQTPGKSILKKSDDTSNSESSIKKSTRKVDFREDVINNEDKVDENLENSIDLGRALARIDSYDSDISDDVFEPDPIESNVTIRNAGKRLQYEDEDVMDNVFDDVSKIGEATKSPTQTIPSITITDSSPPKRFISQKFLKVNATAKRSSSNKSGSLVEKNSPESNIETRILRNRVISVDTPNKNSPRRRRSKKLTIDLDSSTKENQDPEAIEPSTLESMDIDIGSAKSDLTTRRRSTRKSVRFNAEDCTVCTPKKTTYSTPRRNRTVSFFGNDEKESITPLGNGDLMSFETPPTATPKPRRSSTKRRKSRH